MVKELQDFQKEQMALKSRNDFEGGKLYKAHGKVKILENALVKCESRKMAACIKNRNQVSTREIRQDYDTAAKQMGHKNTKPLQVFCVSSWAFVEFAKNAPNLSGFQTVADTGIPTLQEWLIETTLGTRDRNAMLFLEDIISLEMSMSPWIADSSAEFKMAETQREAVDEMFEKNLKKLRSVCFLFVPPL